MSGAMLRDTFGRIMHFSWSVLIFLMDATNSIVGNTPMGNPSLRIGNNLITRMLQIDMTAIAPSVEISFGCSDCHDESKDGN